MNVRNSCDGIRRPKLQGAQQHDIMVEALSAVFDCVRMFIRRKSFLLRYVHQCFQCLPQAHCANVISPNNLRQH